MNNKKKLIIIIISIVVILLIGTFLYFLLHKKDDSKEENKLLSYVESNNIKIGDPDEGSEVHVQAYGKDTNKNIFLPDGVIFDKDNKASYEYYDYNETEPDEDGYVVYSFKVKYASIVKYTVDSNIEKPQWSLSSAMLVPSIFDYYTGNIYLEKHDTNGTVNIYDVNNYSNEEMAFTDMSWNDKDYKVGVLMIFEKVSTEKHVDDIVNNITHYRVNYNYVITYYVKAPKDYDGLLVFLNKDGASVKNVQSQKDLLKHYEELQKEEEKTGEKTEEQQQIEEDANKVIKLLDKENAKGEKPDKDDFYVYRLKDIKKEIN